MNGVEHIKSKQFCKFCAYGFLKNLRFFDVFFLLILLDLEFSFTQIGVLYATREITIYLFEFPAGVFADYYGRRKSLLLSLFIYILSFFIFFWFEQYFIYQMAMVCFGIGEAFRSGTHKGIIMSYLKNKDISHLKVWYYGQTRSWSQWGSFSSAIGALLLMLFIDDYKFAFIVALLPYVLNLINIYTYPKENNTVTEPKDFLGIIKIKLLLKDLTNPKVLSLLNSSAMHSAFLKSIKDYLQYIVIICLTVYSLKLSESTAICLVYLLVFFFSAIASRNAYRLELLDFNVPNVTVYFGIGLIFLTGLMVYFKLLGLAILTFILLFINENLRKPFMVGKIVDHSDLKILTSLLSVESLYKTLLSSILAVCLGFLIDRYDLAIAMMVLAIVLFVLNILPQWFVKTKLT